MFISTVIALLVLNTPYECVQYLDEGATNNPEKSTARYVDFNTVVVTLHGAKVALRCDGNKYTVTLYEWR